MLSRWKIKIYLTKYSPQLYFEFVDSVNVVFEDDNDDNDYGSNNSHTDNDN